MPGVADRVMNVHYQFPLCPHCHLVGWFQFHLSALIVGALFMIIAALYAMSCPVFGWLIDRKVSTGLAVGMIMAQDSCRSVRYVLSRLWLADRQDSEYRPYCGYDHGTG